ncbi:MAG: ImmA/IrrE family metallo-endopeptidase [Mailhella sp.]|nr:ImmA/IrrE family metallo-endopeptidase [Mailhella sp.]
MGGEQSLLYYYKKKVDPSRLTFARELRGLTKKALADKLGKKASAITQFEAGTLGMSFETFSTLVKELEIHPGLLSAENTQLPSADMANCHFRANKRVPQMLRQSARCYALQVLSIYNYLEELGVKFPPITFNQYSGPSLSEQQMEEYAVAVRHGLGLKLGPIQNMAEFLENIGIRIVILDGERRGLDAFAAWISGQPCIMLDKEFASRMPFDYAHEFAHLLLDEDTIPGDLMAERRANRFASAFLMPAASFVQNCPSRYGRAAFIETKLFWRVSIAAALYRAKLLGVMSERSYTNAMINRAKANENIHEPAEFSRPMPTLLAQAMKLVSKITNLKKMSEHLGILQDELEHILLCQNVSQEVLDEMKPEKRTSVVLQFRPLSK